MSPVTGDHPGQQETAELQHSAEVDLDHVVDVVAAVSAEIPAKSMKPMASSDGPVAPSTVSRAMSNPNRVSPEMYERIVRKARELGYESATLPSSRQRIARGTIALVLPNLTNPFNLDLIRGSRIPAQAAGFMQLLVISDESEQVEAEWLVELAESVDGIVLASPRTPDALLHQVAERVPLVVLNREVPWISGLVVDTPSGLAQRLDYLVSLGHQRIAYVRGPASPWTDQARYRALRTAASRLEVELIPVRDFRPPSPPAPQRRPNTARGRNPVGNA